MTTRLTLRTTPAPADVSRERADTQIGWLREYAVRRIDARTIDEHRCIPPYIALDFGAAGLFGPLIEERYGGTALRLTDLFRVLEQLMAVDTGLGTWVGSSVFLGTRSLSAWGTDALKAEWLPRLASGQVLGAYAQTEPGAGSDFSALATRAEPLTDGRFLLSGAKQWIGNGSWAGVATVVARCGAGVVALAVPTASAGVRQGDDHASHGLRGMAQSRLRFDDVVVDAGAVLGGGQGRVVALDSMSLTRLAASACAVGAMKRVAQLAHRFASGRSMSGIVLAERAATRRALGTLVARVDIAHGLVHALARSLDAGRPVDMERVVAVKVMSSAWVSDATDTLVQLLGSRGYDEAHPAARMHRDLRAYRIFEGATEALTDFLGRRALSRPEGVCGLLGKDTAGRLEPVLRELGGSGDDVRNAAVAWAVMWAFAVEETPDGSRARPYADAEFDAALAALHPDRPTGYALTAAEIADAIHRYEDDIGSAR